MNVSVILCDGSKITTSMSIIPPIGSVIRLDRIFPSAHSCAYIYYPVLHIELWIDKNGDTPHVFCGPELIHGVNSVDSWRERRGAVNAMLHGEMDY